MLKQKKIKYDGATFKRINDFKTDNGTKVEFYECIHQLHDPKYIVKFDGNTIELSKGELEHYLNYKFGGIKND